VPTLCASIVRKNSNHKPLGNAAQGCSSFIKKDRQAKADAACRERQGQAPRSLQPVMKTRWMNMIFSVAKQDWPSHFSHQTRRHIGRQLFGTKL